MKLCVVLVSPPEAFTLEMMFLVLVLFLWVRFDEISKTSGGRFVVVFVL